MAWHSRCWTRAWTKIGIPFPPVLALSFLLNQVKMLKEHNKFWKQFWKLSQVIFLIDRSERFCYPQVERFYLKLRWHWSASAQGAMAHVTIAIAMPEILILPLDEATWQIMRALCTKMRHRAQLKRFTLCFNLKLFTSKHFSGSLLYF